MTIYHKFCLQLYIYWTFSIVSRQGEERNITVRMCTYHIQTRCPLLCSVPLIILFYHIICSADFYVIMTDNCYFQLVFLYLPPYRFILCARSLTSLRFYRSLKFMIIKRLSTFSTRKFFKVNGIRSTLLHFIYNVYNYVLFSRYESVRTVGFWTIRGPIKIETKALVINFS